MDLSIVIAAGNATTAIEETFDSILSQSRTQWEAVVVCDGSRDDAESAIGRQVGHDQRFCVVAKSYVGVTEAWNLGLSAARGDWCLVLDAGDRLVPHCLEVLAAERVARPFVDAIHFGSARVATDGTLVTEHYEPPTGDLFSLAARRAPFPVHACIVRTELVTRVGGFDPTLTTCADWDLWQRVSRCGARFGAVRDVLAYRRMSEHSASIDAVQLLTDGLRVLRQGHAPDTRVVDAHPDHALGRPPSDVPSQVFYLLAWGAGLLLGSDRDPATLFPLVRDYRFAELSPDAVAQCLHESIPLARALAPSSWGALWPGMHGRVVRFLEELEAHAGAPELAEAALRHLRRLALGSSPEWAAAIETLDRRTSRLADENQMLRELLIRDGVEREALRDRLRAEATAHDATRERLALESSAALEMQGRLNDAAVERDQQRDQARRGDAELAALHDREGEAAGLAASQEREVARTSAHRDALLASPEHRFGDLLLNGLHLRTPVLAAERVRDAIRSWRVLAQLAADRRSVRHAARPRIMAATCATFPIYSQTFVHQELAQLTKAGFPLRHVYSTQDSKEQLRPEFHALWDTKTLLKIDHDRHRRDFSHYQRQKPSRVESLIEKLSAASGMTREAVVAHGNFLQAFTFTRMVEAWQPGYLHTYFFYDRSLMALVAGYLLDIPRGVSCYADHLLQDYELKVVPLHLELCDIVVATSERIRAELLGLSSNADPERILVKPNAIDTTMFPVLERCEPGDDAPYRVVTVCRIEPKKGLLELVEGVSLLRERGLHVEAHIVGGVDEWSPSSREYKAQLDQRITELELWGTVHLEGRQDMHGLLRLLGIASIFVAPFVETDTGDKDGIPTALLEAMATALPVVATTAGSIPEVVTHGIHGLLVPERDPAGLADAIAALLLELPRRAAMGAAGAAMVREMFDASHREQAFHERILQVIGRRAPAD